MREKFNNLSTRNKVLCIAIPVIVIALLILLCVGLTNKNTQDTKDVATIQNTSSTDYTLDVESVVKDEADAVEETTKVEPEAAVSSAVDSVTSTVEVMSPVEETTNEVESEEVVSEQNVIIENEEAALNSSSDDLYHSWNLKATWTASNGVKLKIVDGWAETIKETGDGAYAALWQDDPEADWSPNSLYMDAVHEFIYGDPAYKNGTDRYNPEVVKVSDLPAVSTVSSKQASISVTPEFSAYKEQYDKLALFQATGNTEGSTTLYQLQVNNDFAGASVEGQGYMWDIRKNSDGGFKISIYRNLSELDFNGLLTVLKLITPDAQAVYNAVYEDVYVGCDIPSFGAWYPISGSNSQIYVTDTTGLGYMEYSFK